MNKNNRKGIRLIMAGFLAILLDLHLKIGTLRFSFIPDFAGWILISIGCSLLKDQRNYQYGLVMTVVSIVCDLIGLGVFKALGRLLSAVCFFFVLSSLSSKENGLAGRLHMLRYVYLCSYILSWILTQVLERTVLTFFVNLITLLVSTCIVLILYRMSE